MLQMQLRTARIFHIFSPCTCITIVVRLILFFYGLYIGWSKSPSHTGVRRMFPLGSPPTPPQLLLTFACVYCTGHKSNLGWGWWVLALQTPVVLNAIIFPSKGREASNERTTRNNDIIMSIMRELKENNGTVIN